MINPATRKAAAILAQFPGLHTDDLLDAIPAAGEETISALHRDGRCRYGYGQDVQGRWWLRADNPVIEQALTRSAEHTVLNRHTQEAS